MNEATKKSLRELRTEAGKSRMQYAKEIGIPYTTYTRYEEDLGKAPFDIVVKICETLHIDIKEIAC